MTRKQLYKNIINKYNDINFYEFKNEYSIAFSNTMTVFVGNDISCMRTNDSIFTLLHEIGHIYINNDDERRCVNEYLATVWAINNIRDYNLEINDIEKKEWQDYIYVCRNKDINNGLIVPDKNKLILWE